MTDEPSPHTSSPDAARASVQQADEMAARTVRQARWVPIGMAAFAIAVGALTLLIGSAAGPHEMTAPVAGFVVLLASSAGGAASRPVRVTHSRRTQLAGWIGTGALCAAALTAGTVLGWPLWAWAIASAVVALPLAAAAWAVDRTLR